MLADKLIEYLTPYAEQTPVEQVVVGARYSAVSLKDGRVGIAMNFSEDEPLNGAGERPPFEGTEDPVELLSMYTSADPVRASVGVALANALSVGMIRDEELLSGNLFDHLGLRPQDRVGMIGNFQPMVPRLRESVAELHIFELIDEPIDGLLPTAMAPALLPTCDVVIITGTTLVNGTIDGILPWCFNAREVAVVGPTTTIVPQVFAGTGITLLGGAVPQDTDAILEIITNGQGARACLPHFRKVIYKMPRG